MVQLLKRLLYLQHVDNNNESKHDRENFNLERTFINALMENTSDNIYFKDNESRFIRINKALAHYFNLSDPGEAIGKTDFDFFSEEHALQAFEDEQIILKTGQTICRDEKETWKKQPDSWVSTVKMPLRNDNGKIIGTFGISRNITDMIKAEFALKEKNEEIEAQNEEYQQINKKLQQLNKELSVARTKAEASDKLKIAFLQNMTHEIRTPLNAIVGFANLMVDERNNKYKLEEYNAIINQHCSDLLDMINDILDIAKIESGQLQVNHTKCELNKLFSEILTFFKEYQKQQKKQHIEFNFRINCDPLYQTIITDEAILKKIFINLINNAFKFTDIGKIQFGCMLNENNKLQFFVLDTGIGIPADKKVFVFERFAQIEHGNDRSYGGTGLGLYIVKRLIDILEGEIWFESEPGKGSTFYFSLPNELTQIYENTIE